VAGTDQASAGSNPGRSAWAGSYWADTVTLTGGTGTGDVAMVGLIALRRRMANRA